MRRHGGLLAALSLLTWGGGVLALSWLCGEIRFEPGARSYLSSPYGRVGMLVGLHWLAVLVLLVFPITHSVYPFARQKRGPWFAYVLLLAFSIPPLFSYLSYLGKSFESQDLVEIFLTVLGATSVAAYGFLCTERVWLYNTLLVLGITLPSFVVNDVMSPFFTLWNYYPRSAEGIIWFRGVAVALVQGVVVWRLFKGQVGLAEHPAGRLSSQVPAR